MGGNPSILAPRISLNTVSVSSYIDVLDQVHFEKTVSDNRFLKTLQCSIDKPNKGQRKQIVVKLFIKPDSVADSSLDLSLVKKILDFQRKLLSEINGVVPFSKYLETDRAGYMIRQHVVTSLYDRFNTRPFLDPIERLWIVFQLLSVIANCHSKNVYHLDIKAENVVVASWNSVFLTDFASAFKPLYLPEDNPADYFFYFDTSQRRNCYLAPERFYSKGQAPVPPNLLNLLPSQSELLEKMEIFSLGCVFAELYLDGGSIFTLSQLFKYKTSSYEPNLSNISNPHFKNMVKSMISLDPKNRRSAAEYLREYRGILFPESFYTFLEKSVTKVNIMKDSDDRVLYLYSNFDSICKALNVEYKYEHVEHANINEVPLFPMQFNLPGIPSGYVMKSTKHNNLGPSNGEILIILNLVISCVRNTSLASSRIKGVELLIALSEKVQDEVKLDRVLPFIISLLEDESLEVRIFCLKALTQLFAMVDSITPINIMVFPEYVFQKLRFYLSKDYCSSYEKIMFAIILPNLALNAIRFHDMSQFLKAATGNQSLVMVDSLENSDESVTDHLDVAKDSMTELMRLIEFFTLFTLTGDESTKISILSNIHILCGVLGKEKTNDVILSHLITYLNDKSSYLRLAFVKSIIGISVYVGSTSLEQYILPLMKQSLADPEEFIIIQVLRNFTELVKLDLINKTIIWDWSKSVSTLILHPNEWIRQNSLIFLITVAEKLSLADVFCTLYPIIVPYLEYEVTEFTWDSLYPCAKKALSRNVYDIAILWCQKATNSSFWDKRIEGSSGSRASSSSSSSASVAKSISGMKSITGMISKVAIRDRSKKNSSSRNDNEGKSTASMNGTHIQLTNEDALWIKKLKASGLQDSDLWKIYVLRNHIINTTRAQSLKPPDLKIETEIRQLGTYPNNVVIDVVFQSPTVAKQVGRPLSIFEKVKNSNFEVVAANGKQEKIIKLDKSPSMRSHDTESIMSDISQSTSIGNARLISPVAKNSSLMVSTRKATPSLLTNQEHVYAEIDTVNQTLSGGSFDADATTKNYLGFGNAQTVVPVMTHSYTGNNQNVLRFLDNYEPPSKLEFFYEFGPQISSNIGEKSFIEDQSSWPPKGILVAHLLEHTMAITALETSPDHSYFVSGSEDGYLKIWDCLRLERNVTSESILSINLKSPVKSICFMGNRDCFAISTKNSVKIFRVSMNGGKTERHRSGSKVRKLIQIRSFRFENQKEYAISMKYTVIDNQAIIICVTSFSRIIGFDVIKMEPDFILQNPLSFGVTTTFGVNKGNTWVMVGTSLGFISLWDLRFKINLVNWKFKAGKPIQKISTEFNTLKHCLFSIMSGNNGLCIYELNKGKIEKVYSAGGVQADELIEVDEDDDDNNADEKRGKRKHQDLRNLKDVILSEEEDDDDVNEDNFNDGIEHDGVSEQTNESKDSDTDFSLDNIEQLLSENGDDDANEKIKSIDDSVSSFTELKVPAQNHKRQLYLFSSNSSMRNIMFWDIFHSNNSKSVVGTYQKRKNSKSMSSKNQSKEKKTRLTMISSEQKELIKNHHDVITSMVLLCKPFFMIVSGDRSGVINVYK